jgi:hypothetical protein
MSGGQFEELGLDLDWIQSSFALEQSSPYSLARLVVEDAEMIAGELGLAIRRCYVDDAALNARALTTGVRISDLIAAKLPDAGSTMAGDFGEILTFIYLAASKMPVAASGPLKWRLKQDRTKPVPHSDVLLFVVPNWPTSSDADVIVCAEVKTKATPGTSSPIQDAIRDSARDRTSRLTRTLQWLRERALHEEVPGADLGVLDRFSHPSDHPPSQREFVAAVVLAESLSSAELTAVPTSIPAEHQLLVLIVTDLQSTYASVFSAAATAGPQ